MHVALVENAEDDIHDEDGSNHQEWQRLEKLLQDETFALNLAFDSGRQYFGRGFLDVVDRITERYIGFEIESKGHARELI